MHDGQSPSMLPKCHHTATVHDPTTDSRTRWQLADTINKRLPHDSAFACATALYDMHKHASTDWLNHRG